MDPSFAEALYAAHRPALFRFLRRMTGDPVAAEELTQDVFVRALRRLPDYDRRERDRAWLFRIARHLAMDDRRARSRRPREVAAVAELAESATPAAHAAPHVALDLTAALAALPASDRECFLLREQGGLGYDEIASLTSLSPDAVRNRIYRARCALRRALESRA